MNKRLLLACALCVGSIALYAQQIPLFTQYREAQGILNPAAINYDFFTHQLSGSVGLSYRKQWTDVDNAPTTQILRGEYFMADRTGVTLLAGGYLMNDQTGPTGFSGVYGRIAGVVTSDASYSGLSLGLSAGAVQYRLKTSELKARDKDDIRVAEERSQTQPDIGFGLFYYQRLDGLADDDYIYGGLSVPQALGRSLNFADGNTSDINIRRLQHFYGTLGWYHFFRNGRYIEPSVWIKYTKNTPINVDFNVRYSMTNAFWIGVGTATNGKMHAETGLILGSDRTFKIGYGFDYTLASYGPYIGSSHEFNISFAF